MVFFKIIFWILLPCFVGGQVITPPGTSYESGFYSEEFSVVLDHPDDEVDILYTLDGSEPRIENLYGKVWQYKNAYPTYKGDQFGPLLTDTAWTYIYKKPILIQERSDKTNRYADIAVSIFINEDYLISGKDVERSVFKGTSLRMVAYKEGAYSEVITKNYFVTPESGERYALPVVCLTVEPEELFGYEVGWNVPGIQFDDWRSLNPSAEPGEWTAANYQAKGSETERMIHFAYFVNGEEVLSHGAGLRANGNSSRVYPNRSLRLYAKKDYGPKNFEYPFFEGNDQDQFKRLILRNGGQDTEEAMFRDALIQQAAKNLNTDIQEYQPVIVFINGEYWGLYNLRERFDKKYFDQKYGVDEKDLDFIEKSEAEEGDMVAYNAMMDFVKNHDLGEEGNYEQVSKLIDIEHLIDYYAVELYAGNVDWPQSNMDAWRKRVDYTPEAPYGHDGRWRWILKDLDLSMGKRWGYYAYHENDIERVTTLSSSDSILNNATILIRKLLENEIFREQFNRRFTDLLNTNFKSSVMMGYIEKIVDALDPEMEEFIARWNPQGKPILPWSSVSSYKKWKDHVAEVIKFTERRPDKVREHLRDRFDLGRISALTLDISEPDAGIIQINALEINERTIGVEQPDPYPWTGYYFQQMPVTLLAKPDSGYVLSHWVDGFGNVIDTADTLTLYPSRDQSVQAVFIKDIPSGSNYTGKETVRFFPNPFDTEMYVHSNKTIDRFWLYSIDGRLVKQGDWLVPLIHGENLSAGIYILWLEVAGEIIVKKIVKL